MYVVGSNAIGTDHMLEWVSQESRKRLLVHKLEITRNKPAAYSYLAVSVILGVVQQFLPFGKIQAHPLRTGGATGYRLSRFDPGDPSGNLGPSVQIGWYYLSGEYLTVDYPEPVECGWDGTDFWSYGLQFSQSGEGASERSVNVYFSEY